MTTDLFKDPNMWLEYLFKKAPYRTAGEGNAAAFYTFLPGMMADTLQQMITDFTVMKFHKLGSDFTSNDYLGTLANEFGLVIYEGDTEASIRERLSSKWDIVQAYGTQVGLQSVLEECILGTYEVNINTEVLGTDTAIARPKNAGISIQPYPPHTENKRQFTVTFTFTSAPQSGEYSNIVSDKQFTIIRECIRRIKPAIWACREVRFIYNPSTELLWNGQHTYDEASLVWSDADAESEIRFERHSYQQRI